MEYVEKYHKLIIQIMFLILFLRITSANIWDNMFGNYDAPLIDIPNDFKVQLGYEFMR